MTQEALKKMYQLLLTEPHAPTVCAQLERIAREALAEHAMRETQKLGQEIEQCQCTECQIKPHASDCAVHSEPAYPKGKCDCGAQTEQEPVAECPNLKGKSMNKDEALTLEALKFAASKGYGRIVHDMKITPFTIKYEEALAQPEQEPVAHCKVRPLRGDESFPKVEIDWVNQPVPGPLYTSPPQRTWVGLEKKDMPDGADPLFDDPKFIAGMVYAANKLMEKNT